MSILGELQKFNGEAVIEMFILDTTNRGGEKYYFHAGTNDIHTPIIWQGQEYTPIPIECTEFELSGTSLPRPKMKLANINGVFSAMVTPLKDLVGCKVTRKRTLGMYLDAVNFSGGNPTANPTEEFPEDIFYITQKTSENKVYIEFALGSALDLTGVKLPRGQVIAGVCRFRYRGAGCNYAGGAVATDEDIPTNDITKDRCSHAVSGCKLRFGEDAILPFGGFPGAALVDQ